MNPTCLSKTTLSTFISLSVCCCPLLPVNVNGVLITTFQLNRKWWPDNKLLQATKVSVWSLQRFHSTFFGEVMSILMRAIMHTMAEVHTTHSF